MTRRVRCLGTWIYKPKDAQGRPVNCPFASNLHWLEFTFYSFIYFSRNTSPRRFYAPCTALFNVLDALQINELHMHRRLSTQAQLTSQSEITRRDALPTVRVSSSRVILISVNALAKRHAMNEFDVSASCQVRRVPFVLHARYHVVLVLTFSAISTRLAPRPTYSTWCPQSLLYIQQRL